MLSNSALVNNKDKNNDKVMASRLPGPSDRRLSGSDCWVVKHDSLPYGRDHLPILSHSQFPICFASPPNRILIAPSMATLTMQPIGPTPAPAAQQGQRRVLFLLFPFARFGNQAGFCSSAWFYFCDFLVSIDAARERILLPWMVAIWVTSTRGNCFLSPSNVRLL